MGLEKKIVMPNGVELNYHRVVGVNVITNQQNVIEVASYTSLDKRREEKEALEEARETGQYPATNIFIETTMFVTDYDQGMTIKLAYDWLKEQEMFEGAKDVIDSAVKGRSLEAE